MAIKNVCGCKPATRDKNCAYCGVGDGSRICAVCAVQGIDGDVIKRTEAKLCTTHQLEATQRKLEETTKKLQLLERKLAHGCNDFPCKVCKG